MSDSPTPRRSRWGAVAGVLGASVAFATLAGAGPAPSVLQLAGHQEDVSGNCDEAEHATDPECSGPSSTVVTVDDSPSTTATDGSTSTTVDDSPSTTVEPGPGAGDVRSVDANGAGTVTYVVDGSTLHLVAARPATGWQAEVEQAVGREIEVDFRAGSTRVQVNLELEDGQVRVRVRTDGDESPATTVPGSPSPTIDDGDHSGPGHDGTDDDDGDHSGPGHDGSDDDGSGHGGSGRDHPEDD